MLMTKSNRDFFNDQGDVTLMIQCRQFSNLFKILLVLTLPASFRNIRSKLKEIFWWQTFSHCNSMGLLLPATKVFIGFSMKRLSYMPHKRHAIDEKWLKSACSLRRCNWSKLLMDDGRMNKGQGMAYHPINSPGVFSSGEVKILTW